MDAVLGQVEGEGDSSDNDDASTDEEDYTGEKTMRKRIYQGDLVRADNGFWLTLFNVYETKAHVPAKKVVRRVLIRLSQNPTKKGKLTSGLDIEVRTMKTRFQGGKRTNARRHVGLQEHLEEVAPNPELRQKIADGETAGLCK
ncbi:unnamed protein product [Amoebophrya sp. A120]|nr:unnamed protein product [Amoebophrya sp. A120]|eukprot:GSA120T00004230001.1